jgi:tetratricopeptide (TPR) repeat protein
MDYAAGCLLKMKRFDEAEAQARECLALRLKKNPHDWRIFITKSYLGQAMTGLKKYPEGESLLKEAYRELDARRSNIPPRFHRYIGEAAQALADLYDAWGRPEQARAWRSKAVTAKPETPLPPAR